MAVKYCKECGRRVVADGSYWKHEDGRIRHDPVIDTTKEEDAMAPRTRTVAPDGQEYVPILDADDPENASLIGQATEVFTDMESEEVWGDPTEEEPPALFIDEAIASAELSENEVVETVKRQTKPEEDIVGNDNAMASAEAMAERAKPIFGLPSKDDMVTVRGGGLYLTARRRIVWLRGEPEQHPDWTIDTYPEEIERGKFISNNKVEGGYARYRANLFDATGRLISTGTKTEWSERFMDFAEKAETGAIARALAVAGYGTEAALDLDEGYEQDRIADAPVPVAGRAINISASNVGGLVQGGRSENVTTAQLNEIQRLVKTSAMGMTLVPFMESLLEKTVPDLSANPTQVLLDYLGDLTFAEASKLIQALNQVKHDA